MERSPISPNDPLKPDGEPAVAPLAADDTPNLPTLKPGTIIDERLEVQSLIASGGFGSVYKVRHLMMNKMLALKTLHPIAKSDTTVLRLKRESVAISKLDHPNIVHATDFGLIDGSIPFIVMEYVEGLTLSESLKGRPPLGIEEALEMFIPVCEALAYAHDQGVIHRDIKPGNIMLSIDEKDRSRLVPKIVDFGIAKLTFGEDAVGLTLTRTGDVFGTPLYMSPEQCAGTSVDHRTDIYSLGCVLFETLTGTPPVTGNSPLETMMRHASGQTPSLKEASLGKEFPAALEFIVAKMLAKDARQRYESCYEVANDLRLVLHGDSASVRTTAMPARAPDTGVAGRGMDRLVAILTNVAALAIGIGSGIAIQPLLVHNNPLAKVSDPFVTLDLDKPATSNESPAPATAFFHNDKQPNIFHFPKKPTLGKVLWDHRKHTHQTSAMGDVAIPPNSNVSLIAGYNLMTSPAYWGCFHPNDLWGLYLTHVTIFDTEHGTEGEIDAADAAVAAAWQQRELHVLELKTMALHQRAFKLIGSMPNLTNLILNKVELISAQNVMEANAIPTEQIAALPNLPQLDTFCLYEAKGSLTPILNELRKGHLRRLAVLSTDGTQEDIDLVAKLSSVESLEMLTVPSSKQLERFSHMPKLKRLCIRADEDQIKRGSIYKFPGLEKLWLFASKAKSKILKEEYKKLMVLPSGFDWERDCGVGEDQQTAWFDRCD